MRCGSCGCHRGAHYGTRHSGRCTLPGCSCRRFTKRQADLAPVIDLGAARARLRRDTTWRATGSWWNKWPD